MNNFQKKWFGIAFILLAGGIYFAVHTSSFQTWIVKKVTNKLSQNLHAAVSIKKVDFQLFDKMLLEGTLVLDQKNDTLLYAGAAKANITDWFFLKENITLKYIGLNDAVIHISRKDSVWNYQFLADYFSSPNQKKDTSNVVKLDLKLVDLKNVKILKQDNWSGQNSVIAFDKLYFATDVFDTKNKVIKIDEINLDHPVYAEYNYNGASPVLTVVSNSATAKPAAGLRWNVDDWVININKVSIKKGGLSIESAGAPVSSYNTFDGSHIVISDLNAALKNVQVAKDTITANINLSARDRSGVEIKKLLTDFKFTPVEMEFKNLDLTTNRSHIKNYYAMRYKNFSNAFPNFSHDVSLEGDFKGSEISSDDIAFFAPQLKSWQRNFLLNGNLTGTIDNLSGRKMDVHSGDNFFNGDFLLRGLTITDNVFINLDANDLATNYTYISSLIPSIKNIHTPDLSALGNIYFKGNFTGFFSDFVMNGLLKTSMGNIVTDMHMSFPANTSAAYTGKVAINNFEFGKFINDNNFGKISFSGNISGKGFDAKNADVLVDGIIPQIEFNNYNYQNIIAKGNLKNKIFKGEAGINDPNLKVNGLTGTIDFSKEQPQFNFDADIAKFDLKNLKLSNDSIAVTGKFNLNFSGNNIDNFLGYAKVYKPQMVYKDQKISFDSLSINSSIFNGKKYLSVKSNDADVDIAGNFKIMELPQAFQFLLNKYYPSYINKPKQIIHNQDFSFNIITRHIADYMALISKKIKGFDNSNVSGNLNLLTNDLSVKANVPSFNFSNINFNNINFNAAGNLDTLALSGNIEDVVINDSLHLPGTKISVTAYNDISDISIKTSANETLNEADLSARLQTLPDGFKLNFNPSSLVINQKKWILEKGGELLLSKKLLTATEVKFVQNEQQIILSTEPSSTGSSNDILIDTKKLNIADIAPFFIKAPKLEGLMTGNIKVTDPFGKMSVDFVTQTDQFRLENDSIGMLKTSGNYSALSGDVIVNASSNNQLYNFIADITYKTKDSTTNQLNGSLNLDKFPIHFLEKYIGDIFSGINGIASGQLNILGLAKDPKITGSLSLNDAALTVNYTRCRYSFQNNSIIKFNKDEIDFGNLKLRDTLNNTATVTGKLYHTFFDNFFFNDLHFKTDRKNGNPAKFVLLDTKPKDNKEFYGYMIGEADMNLYGPISDMKMNIAGEPTDSSHLYLPTGATAETGKINYIEFIKFGREMQADLTAREETNIKVDIDIISNPFAKIDVILDETTGDVIKAQGSGKLNIIAGTKEPLSIRGRYDVQEGQYTFNFQTFLKTPFNLQSGYIEWQGDPYLANLNIDAVYRATQVDLSSIATSRGINSAKGDVDIIFKLRGTLKDPRPEFEFVFPFDNPLKSDPIANQYLKTKYQSDKNELNKQVTSLLLFNSFSPDQQSLFSTNNTGSFVFRTVGQILSGTLSSSLNNWLQKLLKTNAVNLYTNINTADFNFANSGTQKQLQNLGNFGFKTSFLKNRLLVNFGGNVDYRLIQSSGNANSNFLFTPDVSFEYFITPNGGLRVVGFNRSDADIGDIAGVTRRNRTGVLLSYRKDFNRFTELFGVKK